MLVKQGYVPPVHDFTMTDTSGIDYTEQVLNYEKPVLLVVMHKLEKSEVEGLEMLHKLQEYAEKNNWAIIGMTSTRNTSCRIFVKAAMNVMSAPFSISGKQMGASSTVRKFERNV